MIKLYDILKAEKTGLSDSLFTAMLAKKLSGSPAATVKTLEGVPPLTFTAIGEPLIEWSIDGNMQQTGTPSSSSPIFPSETGELVESGAHSGEYAIPIVCGGSTTNIYLSEPIRKIGNYVDTAPSSGTVTRNVYKWELAGTENWNINDTQGNRFFYLAVPSARSAVGNSDNICSHFSTVTFNATGAALRIYDNGSQFADVTAFKAFLAQEYTNGTPVTVWYVLTTAETESVTAPTIPTANGSNTLNVNTTLAPSNVYIKYKG